MYLKPFTIQFLLRYHHVTTNKEASDQAILSLDKMIEGGIYDQIGGGFARYSTDTEWLAPHFEKMLYDNALLVSVLSEAYQLTRKERYKEVIDETIVFIQRELLDSTNGFYSALDADSEGIEGKFYVWDKNEIDNLLKDDAAIFNEYYDVTEHGNWEEKNILRVRKPLEKFAAGKNISIDKMENIIGRGSTVLLNERAKRIRPALDDKIILGWNALMNTACSRAFAATGNETYKRLAIDNMNFLLKHFAIGGSQALNHTWKNGIAKYPAFLDDYAFVIQALVQLHEITADTEWLIRANALVEFVISDFSEPETGYFFYTRQGQDDVIIRKKEVYDGAVPSGNSVMAYNLYQLSLLFDKPLWKQRSIDMISSLSKAIIKYPTSFGNWACLAQEITAGTAEIVIAGEGYSKAQIELLREYIPHKVLLAGKEPRTEFPLWEGKIPSNPVQIWLCRDFRCFPPVFSVKDLIGLINRPKPE